MFSAPRLEPIDIRLVFRSYAVLAGLGGFIITSWGPMWWGTELAGQPPYAKAAFIRVFGAIIAAAGCFAAGFASVNDHIALRRGLFWFGAGHIGVAFMVLLQRITIWGEGLATLAGYFLVVAGLALWYAWIEGAARRFVPISLFAGTSQSSAEGLRSQYEQQIRQAARHEERSRLARDLHDSIKQQIFVIQTAAATVQARFDEDRSGAQQALEQIRTSAREAATEMQVMLDQLRAIPLENAGLIETLKKQCEALGFRTGAHVEFQFGNLPPSDAVPPGAHEAILRVAQEALANTGRHARAANVRVSLGSVHNTITLSIADDGLGFDPSQAPRGLGIANMRARAEEFGGTFELASQPGGGTSVAFSIPVEEPVPPRLYLRNAVLWGAILAIAPLVPIFTGKWQSPATMASVIAAFAVLRNVSAYRRVRGRRSR